MQATPDVAGYGTVEIRVEDCFCSSNPDHEPVATALTSTPIRCFGMYPAAASLRGTVPEVLQV